MKIGKSAKRNLILARKVPAGGVFEYKHDVPCIRIGIFDAYDFSHVKKRNIKTISALSLETGYVFTLYEDEIVKYFPDAKLAY